MGSHRATARTDASAPSESTPHTSTHSSAAPYVGRRIADVAPDFSSDLTVTIPMIQPGKRRAPAPATAHRRLTRGLPSILGAAALAVAGVGAVASAGSYQVAAADTVLRPATAHLGHSGSTAVGQRAVTVSRNSSRDQVTAEQAAKERNQHLKSLNQQAAAQTKSLEDGQWVLPVPADVYHITGTFGATEIWSFHTGLDLACGIGTPIYAVADGTITEVGYSGNAGNRTWEVLADGTEIMYAHQSRFAVSPGDTVKRGQLIGYVGDTGRTTGPHLHIEVHPGGGDPVDPYAAMEAHGIDLLPE